jgi:hypothetical protein
MNAPLYDSSRRRLLARGLGLAGASLLATPLARAAATAAAPKVSFLSREAGAAALAHAPGDTYYADMSLLEIRARMRSALPGMSLADARLAVRDYDAAAALAFTDDERTAIAGVIERMQPLLATRAPLYARTPWSFIKLDDRAEGGMPHTRGPHIVLPKAAVAGYVQMHREMSEAGKLAVTPRGRSLLLHEQTHVLERQDPARFEPLFTQVFGFARMTPAPANAWLSAHRCINPDGPEVAWAFPLEKIGGSGWLMPDVNMPDKPVPGMPDDFESVGVEVARAGGGWQVVERNGLPVRHDLDQVPGYHAHFPFADEDFHPNEIAAVTLAHWILRDVPDIDSRPLMPAVADWARTGLA